MAMAFRAAGTWSFTSNNVGSPFTCTPGAPTGKTVGDTLVLICESRSITATVATPTGWTLHPDFPKRSGTASGGTIYVFLRIADGTATDTPSPVWTGLTTGTSGDSSGAGILCYSGGSILVDGSAQVSDLAAQTTTSVIPSCDYGDCWQHCNWHRHEDSRFLVHFNRGNVYGAGRQRDYLGYGSWN